MGIGSAMAGGNPREGRQEDDFYPTPPEPTIALLQAERFDGIVHEGACGDGTMAKIIEAFGYKVIASDLVNRGYGVQRDFFSITRPVAHNIITNPPFDLADDFIKHSMETLRPRKLALLLKATFFHAKKRQELFERFPPRIIMPLTWRVDFLGKGRPTMECSWFVWHRGNNEYPQYRLLAKPTPEETLRICAIK